MLKLIEVNPSTAEHEYALVFSFPEWFPKQRNQLLYTPFCCCPLCLPEMHSWQLKHHRDLRIHSSGTSLQILRGLRIHSSGTSLQILKGLRMDSLEMVRKACSTSISQWAYNVKMTSYQRRCDVITSHRR